jgi:hypothetical protein
MPDLNARVLRRSLRALVLTPVLLVPLLSLPAFAVPPESWPDAKPVSAFDFLLVLLIIPLGLALLIALLATIPSLVGGQKSGSKKTWAEESEWFGGPKDGVEATGSLEQEAVDSAADRRGGASGRW